MTRRQAADDLPPLDGALGKLLAEASAPARPDELEGISAALTAFHHRPRSRRRPMKAVLTNLLAAKALLAMGAVGVGGVSLAASTGSLPEPAQAVAHDLVGAPAPDSDEQDTTENEAPPTASPTPKATPSPSLIGLCRAYSAGVADAKGKALENPAFTVLITTAGGKDAVPAYCATLLADAPGGKPTDLPTQAQSHKPTDHPTGKPTDTPTHPTGKPTERPSNNASDHPTGKPQP